MSRNKNLSVAKNAKNDEFYTQFADIQKEINAYIDYNKDVFKGKTVLCPCDDPEWSNFTKFFAANFDEYGLKKLISTSYAHNSKKDGTTWQPTLFETESPKYNKDKSETHGKIFTLTDEQEPPRNLDKLEWEYLEGDGDFRSDEVKKLLDESDIIITNPPFSLFREFLAWIIEANKQLVIIGNMNAITYKEVFPLIKDNRLWLGSNDVRFYYTPKGNIVEAAHARWFTNLEHGRRHQPLSLMNMADNIKFSSHKEVRNKEYAHYDNYDAIEVPFTDAIPSDYDGVMGVPISFLDKYCPEQFEIIDINPHFFALIENGLPKLKQLTLHNANRKDPFARILIRRK